MDYQSKITREVGKGNLIAFADVSVGGELILRDVRLMNGEKGLFLGMPRSEWKDRFGETHYADLFCPASKEAYANMLQSVREAYLAFKETMSISRESGQGPNAVRGSPALAPDPFEDALARTLGQNGESGPEMGVQMF